MAEKSVWVDSVGWVWFIFRRVGISLRQRGLSVVVVEGR